MPCSSAIIECLHSPSTVPFNWKSLKSLRTCAAARSGRPSPDPPAPPLPPLPTLPSLAPPPPPQGGAYRTGQEHAPVPPPHRRAVVNRESVGWMQGKFSTRPDPPWPDWAGPVRAGPDRAGTIIPGRAGTIATRRGPPAVAAAGGGGARRVRLMSLVAGGSASPIHSSPPQDSPSGSNSPSRCVREPAGAMLHRFPPHTR